MFTASGTGLWNLGSAALDLSGIYTLVFFSKINAWLRQEITQFQARLLGDTFEFLGAIALTLLAVWIFWQGYRIVSGRSRESMMGLVVDSLRATLIVAAATAFAGANADIYERTTDGLGRVIVGVVANKDVGQDKDALDDLYASMDKSMAAMNLAFGSIQAVQTEPGSDAERDETRNMWFAGIGTAGPAVVGGAMLVMNKIAIALFVGLGPLFILCLLFDQTKSLFQRWLLYGIGTLFSLAVLYVMVRLALDLTLAVTAAYWISDSLLNIGSMGINNLAALQGGIGIILTLLLVTVPMMAANFFSGTLGQFMHYSAFGGGAAAAPSAAGPAGAPYQAQSMSRQEDAIRGGNYSNTPTHATGPVGGAPAPVHDDNIKRNR